MIVGNGQSVSLSDDCGKWANSALLPKTNSLAAPYPHLFIQYLTYHMRYPFADWQEDKNVSTSGGCFGCEACSGTGGQSRSGRCTCAGCTGCVGNCRSERESGKERGRHGHGQGKQRRRWVTAVVTASMGIDRESSLLMHFWAFMFWGSGPVTP